MSDANVGADISENVETFTQCCMGSWFVLYCNTINPKFEIASIYKLEKHSLVFKIEFWQNGVNVNMCLLLHNGTCICNRIIKPFSDNGSQCRSIFNVKLKPFKKKLQVCGYVVNDSSMGRQNFSPSHFELEAMKLETSYLYNVLKPNTQHKQTC